MKRGVYRHQDLARLFNPASIAIYGISPNPKSFGARTAVLLKDYLGELHLVNSRYDRIGERICHPSIQSIVKDTGRAPDCVLIAVPQAAVEQAITECAEAGVGGVVIYASNYAETRQPDLVAAQQRIAAIARDSGLKVLGPNCIGFINFSRLALASFAAADIKLEVPQRPGVALVSQSGGVGFGLGQGAQRGMSMSHVVTTGNACDVDIADIVSYLAEDPACASIACLFEGMTDPSRFLEAGEIAWKAGKPVVVSKLAFGEKGAAAAMSHTGLLAGSSKAYQALFERCGIVSLPSLDGLLETASFLAKAPAQPSATGVAVIAASGGAVVAASDMAELYGVPLPQPNQQLHDFLATKVPAFGTVGNPCDCTAAVAGDADTFLACIEAMLADEAYGTIVIPQAGLSARTHERRKRFSVLAQKLGKPICLPFIGGWTGGPGTTEAEMDAGFGWFYSLDRCFATLAAWHRRAALIDARKTSGPRQLKRVSPQENASKARDLIRAANGRPLTERQAKAALSLYGIPVVHEQLERSAKDAAAAASFIGFPVVLKVESPDIPHKTEAGGISLNLRTEQEVAAAFDTIMANAKRYAPQARINGVLVQPMAKAGVEVMVGVKRDPLFGPLVLVSLGGVFVELLKDSVVDLAPVNREEALAMLDKLKGRDIFKGFRGAPPVNPDRLAEVIVRVSEFGADQSGEFIELDINPLICAGDECIAVDALIVPDTGSANQ